jgi:hypothetical protein
MSSEEIRGFMLTNSSLEANMCDDSDNRISENILAFSHLQNTIVYKSLGFKSAKQLRTYQRGGTEIRPERLRNRPKSNSKTFLCWTWHIDEAPTGVPCCTACRQCTNCVTAWHTVTQTCLLSITHTNNSHLPFCSSACGQIVILIIKSISHIKLKVKLSLCFNWALCHEGILGREGLAPHILNLSTRWRWVVTFKPRPL